MKTFQKGNNYYLLRLGTMGALLGRNQTVVEQALKKPNVWTRLQRWWHMRKLRRLNADATAASSSDNIDDDVDPSIRFNQELDQLSATYLSEPTVENQRAFLTALAKVLATNSFTGKLTLNNAKKILETIPYGIDWNFTIDSKTPSKDWINRELSKYGINSKAYTGDYGVDLKMLLLLIDAIGYGKQEDITDLQQKWQSSLLKTYGYKNKTQAFIRDINALSRALFKELRTRLKSAPTTVSPTLVRVQLDPSVAINENNDEADDAAVSEAEQTRGTRQGATRHKQ